MVPDHSEERSSARLPADGSRSLLAFFHATIAAYRRAEQAAGAKLEHAYNLAGHNVRLRFAGHVLVPHMVPALAHLAADPNSTPALTICLWDTASTSVSPPFRLLPTDRESAHGIPRGRLAVVDDHRCVVFDHLTGMLDLVDTRLGLGICWIADASEVPYHETGAPLRIILNVWLRENGLQMLHAGAVGADGAGVLLVGKGGSGKSTTALACLHAGMSYLGDDYVLASTDSDPRAYSIYNTAKLDVECLPRIQHMLPEVTSSGRPDTEKALLFLHHRYPDRMATTLSIRAILLPHVTGLAGTSVRSVSAAETLRALAPSTLFQLPGADHRAFRAMSRLVRQVPGYVLELGTDLPKIPGVILGLLSQLQAERCRDT